MNKKIRHRLQGDKAYSHLNDPWLAILDMLQMGSFAFFKTTKMKGIGFAKNGYFFLLPKLVNLILIA